MKLSYLKFRCTNEEKSAIMRNATAARCSMSDFCRAKIFHGTVHQAPKLTPEEVEYFKNPHRFNSNFARIANFIKYKNPALNNEIHAFLEEFRLLFEKFFRQMIAKCKAISHGGTMINYAMKEKKTRSNALCEPHFELHSERNSLRNGGCERL